MIHSKLIWIPLLPLLGAALNLLVGRKLPRKFVHFVACSTVLGSLGLSLHAVYKLYGHVVATGGSGKLTQTVYEWISAGAVSIDFGLVCDQLTAVMLVTITLVGSLIHIYSTSYMGHDKSYARFFGYLNLFTGAMLILVLADNLVLMFVGWEGVGVCSYLLIGFWYDKSGTESLGDANANAGRKAFIVNRIGDFAVIIAMFVLFFYTHTLRFEGIAGQVTALNTPLFGSVTVASLAALLLFIGATGKSAQIPLYVWLPDAMAGPTPVSALIHAATMVTAGVYMIARMNVVYMLSPSIMAIVALIGALTAFIAATIGFTQNDIKKVLAYSTVSQLGYMFMGVGVGAFSAGIFHVFTHAFFKACLFLCAGAIIHALHHEQDIRVMGGLQKKLPKVWLTFFVSTLAIAGIFPFSGFFSKDEILWQALSANFPAWGHGWLNIVLYVLGLLGAAMTAFYMFRLYSLTFKGRCRLPAEKQAKIHAADFKMAGPLLLLALGALTLGVLGIPQVMGDVIGIHHSNFFHLWLSPVLEKGALAAQSLQVPMVAPNEHLAHNHGLEWGLMFLSVGIAVVSSVAAFRLYRNGPAQAHAAKNFAKNARTLYLASYHKYWVDEMYQVIVEFFKVMANFAFYVIDKIFIDTLMVRGTGWVVDRVGRSLRKIQNGSVQHYAVALLIGLVLILYFVSKPPSQVDVAPGNVVVAGQAVHFVARRNKVDQRELEYRWDFNGDGTWDQPTQPKTEGKGVWSPRASATHVFSQPGEYLVIMRVHDKRWDTYSGRSIKIKVVPVGSAAAPTKAADKTLAAVTQEVR